MNFKKLKARDPSILACNLPTIPDEESDNKENYLCVYLRIKPCNENYNKLYEIRRSRILYSKIPDGSTKRNLKDGQSQQKKYEFSKIFGPNTKQEDLFNELVKPKLFKFINGDDCTLMTYGVTGSGKTYTIVGTINEPGLLPRSLEYLFRTLQSLDEKPTMKPLPHGQISKLTPQEILKETEVKETILNSNWPKIDRKEHVNTYRMMQSRLSCEPVGFLEDDFKTSLSVWVSFSEIYNETIYDLLQADRRDRLKLMNVNGQTFIKDLTLVHVTTGMEAFQVLQYGLHKLQYAKTEMNDHSSRSHSIFTIYLCQAGCSEDDYYISHFNFCDLAGAERVKKTKNVGDRLKESNNINTSLMVLGRCITAVRNAQKTSDQRLIPFRESKLTQIFQRALSGFEEISMIVNMNPHRDFFEESQHVLNFSAIAKEVIMIQQFKTPAIPQQNMANKENSGFITNKQGSSTNLDDEIAAKELRNQELLNRIAEMTMKIEEEQMQVVVEYQELRERVATKYERLREEQRDKQEQELLIYEMKLEEECNRKYKELLETMKKKDPSIDWDYDTSSSEEDDEDGKRAHKIRKHNPDCDTITVYSSDEEDDLHFWRMKFESQEKQIAQRLEMKSSLEKEVAELLKSKVDSDKLDEVLRKQELRIAELKKKLEEKNSQCLSKIEELSMSL